MTDEKDDKTIEAIIKSEDEFHWFEGSTRVRGIEKRGDDLCLTFKLSNGDFLRETLFGHIEGDKKRYRAFLKKEDLGVESVWLTFLVEVAAIERIAVSEGTYTAIVVSEPISRKFANA